MADDLLTRVRAEIDARLVELSAAVAEYDQLLSAAGALAGDVGGEATRAPSAPAVSAAARKAPVRRVAVRKAAVSKAPTRKVAARKVAVAPPARPASPAGAPALAKRPRRDAAQQAIVAALEHGSHTVSELGVVTALSGASIREGLRRLAKTGTVARATRAGDGKAAYALSRPAAS